MPWALVGCKGYTGAIVTEVICKANSEGFLMVCLGQKTTADLLGWTQEKLVW